ncbi:MAG: flippase-like domain-containing protein [Planctomycetaceae bacterium]|nr:flippase-like domain-containing protein [Planctomycetaceae bacterium]
MLIRWTLFFASLALLALIVVDAGPFRIAADLHAQGWAILPFIALSAVENGLHSISCRRCIVPAFRPGISAGRMFLLYHLAYAINLVTPTGDVGGDIARGLAMGKQIPPAEAASAVLINKFTFSIARMGVAGLCAGIAVLTFPMQPRETLIIGAGSALTLAALVLFAVFQARGLLGAALVRVARLGGRRRQDWMRRHATELDEALRTFYRRHRRDLAASIGFDALGFLVGAAQRIFLMRVLLGPHALAPAVLILAGLGVWGITTLADMIFFFVVGRLGIREGASRAAFQAVGLSGSTGVSVSVVDRIDQLFWTFVGLGVYAALRLRRPAIQPEPE